jgi:hypothetical protein
VRLKWDKFQAMKYRPRRRAVAFLETRLAVDPHGDWRTFTATLPKDCEVLGTVTIGKGDTGALVRLAPSKNYVKVTDGTIAMLNQRQINIALQIATEGRHYAPEMVSADDWQDGHTPEDE